MKICNVCEQEKDESQFSSHPHHKDGLQSCCRGCQKTRSDLWYQQHRAATIERNGKRRDKVDAINRERIRDYLAAHPCIDCGNDDMRVLEFDHVRGVKVESISRMMGNHISWKKIKAEIRKCEVRCANCHRIRHHEDRTSAKLVM